MNHLNRRLVCGQICLLLAALTMIFWSTNTGIGVALLLMSFGMYWTLTAEAVSTDRHSS